MAGSLHYAHLHATPCLIGYWENLPLNHSRYARWGAGSPWCEGGGRCGCLVDEEALSPGCSSHRGPGGHSPPYGSLLVTLGHVFPNLPWVAFEAMAPSNRVFLRYGPPAQHAMLANRTQAASPPPPPPPPPVSSSWRRLPSGCAMGARSVRGTPCSGSPTASPRRCLWKLGSSRPWAGTAQWSATG